MTIAIILPIFNGLSFTKSCLDSLFNIHDIENKNAKFTLVVVDDASTDGSKVWINDNFPQVVVLEGSGDLWWSGGINKGIKYATNELYADYVLWWNNDIIADVDYFDNLIEVLNQNDINTVVGSKIFIAQDKNIVWAMGGLFDPYSGKKVVVGTNQPDNEELQKPIEVDWLPGMGTLIHKSVFEKIGFVDDKTFPQYHGDSDFTLRAKENNYKVMVYPSLRIYNDTSKSGLYHQESFKKLYKSLFTIRSNNNIKKDFQFYKRFSKSNRAYMVLLNKYFRYIGGFYKWKILHLFGHNRNTN